MKHCMQLEFSQPVQHANDACSLLEQLFPSELVSSPTRRWSRARGQGSGLQTGAESRKPPRAYLVNAVTGTSRAVTPEGTTENMITPDGRFVLARSAQGFAFYPVAGGAPELARGLSAHDYPVQWDSTGTRLYAWDRTFPAHVNLLDPRTGTSRPWLETMPPDPAGLLYANFFLTPDGKSYAYRYRRVLSMLYVTDGLR